MGLPKALRRLTPDRVRHDPRLRALAVGSGLIPPRAMHSSAEAEAIRRLAAGRRCAVEIGVYEGASAAVLCSALPPEAELHLIDPFVDATGYALPPGWGADERATRRVVARAQRHGRPHVHWHIATSAEIGRGWREPVDLVFIDGDHSELACQQDWTLWHPHVTVGGVIAFHDARETQPSGAGAPGPTAVVDRLFRGSTPIPGWAIIEEVDRLVVVRRL